LEVAVTSGLAFDLGVAMVLGNAWLAARLLRATRRARRAERSYQYAARRFDELAGQRHLRALR
jgi:hypothetical protein